MLTNESNWKIFYMILLFPIFSLITNCSQGKARYENHKIKYLSTFSSSRMWEILRGNGNWNEKRISELSNYIKSEENVLFYLPLLLSQINNFDSSSDYTSSEKKIIVQASICFANALNNKELEITKKDQTSIRSGLDNLVVEFYKLCENDETFPKLIYTFDDGPFYGVDSDYILHNVDSIYLKDINSTIVLSENDNISILTMFDHSGNTKWRKILSHSENRFITNVEFVENPILDINDLGYKIGLIGNGEFIHLYLRNDGRFRLFFHSW